MRDGIIFVNRGTPDCRASLKWAKKNAPDMHIISVCIENDPYINLDEVLKLATEENIEHFTIPYDTSFMATQNQNVEKAWQFERHFKALQYQRKLCMLKTPEQDYNYILTSLRGSAFEKELVSILRDYVSINQFMQRFRIQMDSYISYPLEDVASDEEFANFMIKEGLN